MRHPEEIVEKVIVTPETVKFYTSLCKVKQMGNPKAPKSDFTRICHKLSKKSSDKDAQLAADEELGDTGYPLAKVVSRWPYMLGLSLVDLKVVPKLKTKMHRVHQWYLERSKDGTQYVPIRCKDEDFHHGSHLLWLDFNELYELYNQEALAISILKIWTL